VLRVGPGAIGYGTVVLVRVSRGDSRRMARPSSIRRDSCAGGTARCVAASGGHNRWRQVVVHRRLATLRRVELQRRIAEGTGEFLLFALTPPRLTTEPEHARQIAAKTLERLRPVGIDGLVLYDIDDESDRNPEERPFPFLPTMDPADYLARDLVGLEVPAIVYRAVSKYPEQQLQSWLSEQAPTQALSVFVGASSREKPVATSLPRAYELRSEVRPDLLLGGVAISERHARGGTEHLRLLAKQAAGCSFFVTQIVYDVNAAKDLVSDYHYECAARGLKPAPIVFTFSVCGSVKTLEFVQWLGVDVPRWIENELRHAEDTLEASYDQAVATAVELIAFCRRVGVPFGVSVESVSIRQVEIDASVRLATRLQAELRR
jgi:Methylenetetrahydrofolate reductase